MTKLSFWTQITIDFVAMPFIFNKSKLSWLERSICEWKASPAQYFRVRCWETAQRLVWRPWVWIVVQASPHRRPIGSRHTGKGQSQASILLKDRRGGGRRKITPQLSHTPVLYHTHARIQVENTNVWLYEAFKVRCAKGESTDCLS